MLGYKEMLYRLIKYSADTMSLYGLVVLAVSVTVVWGHGMMMKPVNRGSLWRVGYDVPPDYDDTQQYCGEHFWDVKPNCGECGDDPNDPRPRAHENTGEFGLGIIVGEYKAGEVIDAMVRLETNHLGYFTFDLCPLTNSKELETEQCFNAHPVLLEDGSERYVLKDGHNGDFSFRLRLPAGVTCEQCVLRWNYRAGNNWGICPDGHGGMGCGPQEHFRSCSDIRIS